MYHCVKLIIKYSILILTSEKNKKLESHNCLGACKIKILYITFTKPLDPIKAIKNTRPSAITIMLDAFSRRHSSTASQPELSIVNHIFHLKTFFRSIRRQGKAQLGKIYRPLERISNWLKFGSQWDGGNHLPSYYRYN